MDPWKARDMTKKDYMAARVAQLWAGGERRNAIILAEAEKMPAENWPDGMAAHKKEARL